MVFIIKEVKDNSTYLKNIVSPKAHLPLPPPFFFTIELERVLIPCWTQDNNNQIFVSTNFWQLLCNNNMQKNN